MATGTEWDEAKVTFNAEAFVGGELLRAFRSLSVREQKLMHFFGAYASF